MEQQDSGQGGYTMEGLGNGSYRNSDFQMSALTQGMQLVAAAARRVWDELYIFKKPVS